MDRQTPRYLTLNLTDPQASSRLRRLPALCQQASDSRFNYSSTAPSPYSTGLHNTSKANSTSGPLKVSCKFSWTGLVDCTE